MKKKSSFGKLKKGTLKAAAKRAGVSMSQFCNKGNLSTLMKRKCAFYKNVAKG